MAKTFRARDVDQVWPLPPSVHDFVPPGHLAHFVRDTVREGLDLSAILLSYAKPLMTARAEKLKRAGRRSRYRLRKHTVEPVFGQIKQARGFRQFLLRGLDKVRGEWALICTAHNLLKRAAAAE